MFLDDIVKVLYAPHKAFKQVIANPKYLGVIVILVLFIGLQIGYEYSQFSKARLELTSPVAGLMQSYINATNWVGSPNLELSNDFDDYFNNTIYVTGTQLPPTDPNAYYSLFGNSSLLMEATNANSVVAALTNTSDVDCTPNGFQNLSMSIKLIEPQSAPQTVTLTLYSLSDSNYYTYDLTPLVSNVALINQWNELTIPLGPNTEGWTEQGFPIWTNITSLTLQFDYSTDSNITMRLGSLYFRGQYVTPTQYDPAGVLVRFLQIFPLQFLFTWLLLAGVVYIILRVTKNTTTWKPLFVAAGFAMIVMVVRSLVNIVATLTMPVVYYPYDVSFGLLIDPLGVIYFPPEAIGALNAQAQALMLNADAGLAIFKNIVSTMFVVSYVWLGAMTTFAVKAIKPEFSLVKCIAIATVSVAVTLVALAFFLFVV
jgi:hypothetical protein